MPGAPIGNTNAKGKGRKPAWAEKRDAEFLEELWNVGIPKQELREALAQDCVPGKFVVAAKFYAGDKDIIKEIVRKIIPDKIEPPGNAIVSVIVKARRNRAS